MQDAEFLVFWDRDGVRLGGRMILCGDRVDVYGWGGRAGVGFPLGRTLDGRRREWGGFMFNLHNKEQWSLVS